VENLYPLVVADVSKEDQCAAFVEEVVRLHGPIDHAVSCFGAWWQGGERRRRAVQLASAASRLSASRSAVHSACLS
jgi:NAD(P)-dependent dehydrogenase (short-subunit alcohol dehydrogenase family)